MFYEAYATYARQLFCLSARFGFPEGQRGHKATLEENTDRGALHGTKVYNLRFSSATSTWGLDTHGGD